MGISKAFGGLLLVAAIAVPTGARALTIQVSGLDLVVSGAPGLRRADFPSHRVFVGDRAEVVALVQHDGALRDTLATFTTTAPVSGVTAHGPNRGLLTGTGAHPVPAGWAIFTTTGHYRLDIHVSHAGGNETADAAFDIDVVSNLATVVIPPAQVAVCLTPQLQWLNPRPEGWICVNERVNLVVNPTLYGCTPYTLTIASEATDGTSRPLGTRTASPWSVATTFATEGPVKLKAVIRDRNGASADAVVLATVGRCIDRGRFERLSQKIHALPAPDACPACAKVLQRFTSLEKQFGSDVGGIRRIPATLKELDSLEAEVKNLRSGK